MILSVITREAEAVYLGSRFRNCGWNDYIVVEAEAKTAEAALKSTTSASLVITIKHMQNID